MCITLEQQGEIHSLASFSFTTFCKDSVSHKSPSTKCNLSFRLLGLEDGKHYPMDFHLQYSKNFQSVSLIRKSAR